MTRERPSFTVDADPFVQFLRWFDEAHAAGVPMPEAVALATACAQGAPSVRMVLFKGLAGGGFTFFTNYESRKARELLANPRAALCFHWMAQGRQVRVVGRVEQTSRAENEAYFRERPRESQVGAWASPQSSPVASREALEARVETQRQRFENSDIPCPTWWGGFRLVPSELEVWQEGPARLHDRFLYTREGDGWRCERLGP